MQDAPASRSRDRLYRSSGCTVSCFANIDSAVVINVAVKSIEFSPVAADPFPSDYICLTESVDLPAARRLLLHKGERMASVAYSFK